MYFHVVPCESGALVCFNEEYIIDNNTPNLRLFLVVPSVDDAMMST